MPLIIFLIVGGFMMLGSGTALLINQQLIAKDPKNKFTSITRAMPFIGSEFEEVTKNISLNKIEITGITQLPREASQGLSDKIPPEFTMTWGLKLLQKIKNVYHINNLPSPVVSLKIHELKYGFVVVEVVEDTSIEVKKKRIILESNRKSRAQLKKKQYIKDVIIGSDLVPTTEDLELAIAEVLALPEPRIKKNIKTADIIRDRVDSIKYVNRQNVVKVINDSSAKIPKILILSGDAPQGDFIEPVDISESSKVIEATVFGTDSELLLELRLDGRRRLDILSAIQREDGVLMLPLNLILQAVGFPIEVDVSSGVADGWFINEESDFYLNISEQRLEVKGVTIAFEKQDIIKTTGDIYITLDLFRKSFPLDVRLSLSDLTLYLTSTTTLPDRAKRIRRAIWDKLSAQAARAKPKGVRKILPYQLFSLPAIKLDKFINVSGDNNGDIHWSNSLNIQAQGDVVFMGMNLGLGLKADSIGKKIDITASNLSFSKYDSTGDLLGQLKATKLLLGDVSTPAIPLLNTSSQGRGVVFSNQPTGFISDPNLFVLEGDAPSNWDLEIFQNNNLLAFKSIGADGRYRFDNLLLKPGVNQFNLIFHGPNGERREKIKRFFLGAGMVGKGDFYYEVGILESTRPMLPLASTPVEAKPGSAVARMVYGLNRNYSVLGGIYTGPVNDSNKHTAFAGMRVGFDKTFSQVNVTKVENEGLSYSSNIQHRLAKNLDLSAEHKKNIGSQAQNSSDNTLKLGMSHIIEILNFPLNYGINYTRENSGNGDKLKHSIASQQSFKFFSYPITHNLQYSRQGTTAQTEGGLNFSANPGNWKIRGKIAYSPQVEDWLRSMNLSSQVKLTNDILADINLIHNFTDDGLTAITGATRWDIGRMFFNFNGGYSSDDSFNLGVGLSMNFAPESPTIPIYRMHDNTAGFGYGSVGIRVFVDDNQNKIYDEGEELLQNVALSNLRTGKSNHTNATGIAMLYDLTPFSDTSIGLDQNSLPDIYLKATEPIQRIVAHQGFSGIVDYPVEKFGEISGIVSSQQGGNIRTFANLPLLLVDSKGEVIDRIFSDYDGFYLFPALPLGEYKIMVNGDEIANSNINIPPPIVVKITSKEPELLDLNIIITENVPNTVIIESKQPQLEIIY